MVKFILLTTQRSGSTWVTDVLNSHPNVIAYSELFLRTSKERPVWGGSKDVLLWNAYWQRNRTHTKAPFKSIRLCSRYLGDIYTPEDTSVQAIGLKLMYSQLRQNFVNLSPYLLLRKVAILHLVRSNYLNVILSEEALKMRHMSHSHGEVQQVSIHLDPTTLLSKLRKKERKVRWARGIFSRLGLPYLEVSYENLAEGRIGFDVLLRFLGVTSGYETLNSTLEKLNKGTHRELIENYDEVAKLLTGTRYSGLLQ